MDPRRGGGRERAPVRVVTAGPVELVGDGRPPGRRSVGVGLLVLLLAGLGHPVAGAAQEDLLGLAARCGAVGTELHARCLHTALGLRAARATVGLAASGGADIPGTSSTLGKRVPSVPRWGFSLRGGLARSAVPDLGSPAPLEETTWARSVRASGAVGLLNGFSVAPTVGGILSLDILAEVAWVWVSEDDGFGDGMGGFGLGARVGLLRESFTLPGVTVTATRRWLGETTLGAFPQTVPPGPTDEAEGASFETTVTSLRGVVGKDLLFAFHVLVGVGWDRYEGDGTVAGSTSPTVTTVLPADDIESERILYFGGLSYNFLVFQLSAEAGWADGFDPPATSLAGSFDPGDGSWFGSLGFRLIL